MLANTDISADPVPEKPTGFLLPSGRHQRRKRLDVTPYQVTMEKIHVCAGTPTVDPVVTVSCLFSF